MATKLLLIEDVQDLGRSGDIVSVKPGFARNFLLPRGVAVIADQNALRIQERLQEERKKKAADERKEAEKHAAKLEGMALETIVKVDPAGHMYGSVSVVDIIQLIKEHDAIELEKNVIQLKHPIRSIGEHTIVLKFQEDVTASIKLNIIAEGAEQAVAEEKTEA